MKTSIHKNPWFCMDWLCQTSLVHFLNFLRSRGSSKPFNPSFQDDLETMDQLQISNLGPELMARGGANLLCNSPINSPCSWKWKLDSKTRICILQANEGHQLSLLFMVQVYTRQYFTRMTVAQSLKLWTRIIGDRWFLFPTAILLSCKESPQVLNLVHEL